MVAASATGDLALKLAKSSTAALVAFLDKLLDTLSPTTTLGDAPTTLGDAPTTLGDSPTALGDAPTALGDAPTALGDALTFSVGNIVAFGNCDALFVKTCKAVRDVVGQRPQVVTKEQDAFLAANGLGLVARLFDPRNVRVNHLSIDAVSSALNMLCDAMHVTVDAVRLSEQRLQYASRAVYVADAVVAHMRARSWCTQDSWSNKWAPCTFAALCALTNATHNWEPVCYIPTIAPLVADVLRHCAHNAGAWAVSNAQAACLVVQNIVWTRRSSAHIPAIDDNLWVLERAGTFRLMAEMMHRDEATRTCKESILHALVNAIESDRHDGALCAHWQMTGFARTLYAAVHSHPKAVALVRILKQRFPEVPERHVIAAATGAAQARTRAAQATAIAAQAAEIAAQTAEIAAQAAENAAQAAEIATQAAEIKRVRKELAATRDQLAASSEELGEMQRRFQAVRGLLVS